MIGLIFTSESHRKFKFFCLSINNYKHCASMRQYVIVVQLWIGLQMGMFDFPMAAPTGGLLLNMFHVLLENFVLCRIWTLLFVLAKAQLQIENYLDSCFHRIHYSLLLKNGKAQEINYKKLQINRIFPTCIHFAKGFTRSFQTSEQFYELELRNRFGEIEELL